MDKLFPKAPTEAMFHAMLTSKNNGDSTLNTYRLLYEAAPAFPEMPFTVTDHMVELMQWAIHDFYDGFPVNKDTHALIRDAMDAILNGE